MAGGDFESQARALLPLMEEERRAFIKAEHGRLAAAIGAEYWNHTDSAAGFFHRAPDRENAADATPDPYELTFGELAFLSGLEKRVERLNTLSYFSFFQMFPQDRERLALLARMKYRFDAGRACGEEDIRELSGGHAAYMAWKLCEPVKIIMPQTGRTA